MAQSSIFNGRYTADPRLLAWRKFNQAIGMDSSAGILYETHRVCVGEYECIYGNMPHFSLAAVSEHVPVTRRRETMRGRLGRQGVANA